MRAAGRTPRALSRPVPFPSSSRGRAETCAPRTHPGTWERRRQGEARIQMGTETTGQRETLVRLPPPPPGAGQPGSDPLGGECLRAQSGAVDTLAPLSIKASSPRPQPPESFSSSSSICLLTDRGGAMTQPRRAPGAQSHTSPGPEGAVGCGCHLGWGQGPLSGGSYAQVWKALWTPFVVAA